MTTDTLDAPVTTTNPGTQDATTPTADTAAPVTGQQSTQATAGADTSAQAEGNDAAQAVVEYEPFAMPEGVVADDELLGEFAGIAKELKLSQKDAQRITDVGMRMLTKQQEALREAQVQWAESSKTDKEFGGEQLAENLGVAKRALEAFATPELRKLLNDSGLGNHPEVIRTFVRVGKAISEDGRVVSGTRAAGPSDPAKRLFPNQI